MATFKPGDRVRLLRPFERFPHCDLPPGMVGTVTRTGNDVDGGGHPDALAVCWDIPVPGLEEWDNEGVWSADDVAMGDIPADSLEVIPAWLDILPGVLLLSLFGASAVGGLALMAFRFLS